MTVSSPPDTVAFTRTIWPCGICQASVTFGPVVLMVTSTSMTPSNNTCRMQIGVGPVLMISMTIRDEAGSVPAETMSISRSCSPNYSALCAAYADSVSRCTMMCSVAAANSRPKNTPTTPNISTYWTSRFTSLVASRRPSTPSFVT